MRFSMILSLLIALVLAGGAVVGARSWLAAERAQIVNSFRSDGAIPDEAAKPTLVVAGEPISFGERMIANKLTEIEWSDDIRPEGSFEKISDLVIDDSEENARFALTSMTVGEPILLSKVTDPGVRAKLSTALTPGMKAISIRVNDVTGNAGFVLPGDRVDVLLTRDGFVEELLQGAKVLAIDQIADDRKDQPSVVRTVTFEVTSREAKKLTLGAQVGVLSLALRNLTSTDIEPNERITLEDLSDLDVSDEMLEKADVFDAPEEEVVEALPDPDPTLERIAGLEALLQGIAGDVMKLNEPVVVPDAVIEEVVVEARPPAPIVPITAKVGVIRNGQRVEYRVDTSELEDELQQVETE